MLHGEHHIPQEKDSSFFFVKWFDFSSTLAKTSGGTYNVWEFLTRSCDTTYSI